MVRQMGEADALRLLRQSPGVNAVSDYSSGMSVDGADYSQNVYRLNGIPIHFPYHFGGMFSTFNAVLFPHITLKKKLLADAANCLGGVVDVMSSQAVQDVAGGEANVGMMASGVVAAVPLTDNISVGLSGRVSYLDAIYGSMLDVDYQLNDVDVVVTASPSNRDFVRATFHRNGDNLDYRRGEYAVDLGLKWHNTAGGVEWRHRTGWMEMGWRAYYTEFSDQLWFGMAPFSVDAQAEVGQCAVEGALSTARDRKGIGFSAVFGMECTRYKPQWVRTEGMEDKERLPGRVLKAWLSHLSGEVSIGIGGGWWLAAGLNASRYDGEENYGVTHFDPRVSVEREGELSALYVVCGIRHQYLHQVGFSDIGMASNFKIGATSTLPAQRAMDIGVSYTQRLIDDRLTMVVDGYYSRVSHYPEYDGSILGILEPDYVAERYVAEGKGYNVGGNLTVSADCGEVAVWMGYGYCVARRKFEGEKRWCKANTELRHSLKANLTWTHGRHWGMSAAFALASGRPVTPVKAFYLISSRTIMEYGERNSSRLPLYHRLDVGASYRFTTSGRFPLRHAVHLSVLNLYSHRNVEAETYRFNVDDGVYRKRSEYSLYKMMPSLSYTIQF